MNNTIGWISFCLASSWKPISSDGECTLVEGEISPAALCDHYERKKGRDVGGAADQDEDDKGVHYERIPGVPSPGSFKLPLDVIRALSDINGPKAAGVTLKKLFDVDPDDPTIVPAHAVQAHGHGDTKAGHRVLRKFVARFRRSGAQSLIEQPDGHHARG